MLVWILMCISQVCVICNIERHFVFVYCKQLLLIVYDVFVLSVMIIFYVLLWIFNFFHAYSWFVWSFLGMCYRHNKPLLKFMCWHLLIVAFSILFVCGHYILNVLFILSHGECCALKVILCSI